MDMTSEGHIIRNNNVIAQHTVVGNVHISHKQIIAANTGDARVLYRAAMQSTAFANDVMVAYLKPCRLAVILHVLAGFAYRAKLEDMIITPNTSRALDDYM